MGKIIVLDPGHIEKYNAGSISPYYEGTRVYDLALKLKAYLETYDGVTVYLTRQRDENPSLEARGSFAIGKKADFFVSLHSDGAGSPSAAGVSSWYSLKRPNTKAISEGLVRTVASILKADNGVSYARGAFTRSNSSKTDYYGILRGAVRSGNIPYVLLLEHGFHSNPKECTSLLKESVLDAIAKAEANDIAYWLGCKNKGSSTPSTPAPTPTPNPSVSTPSGPESYNLVIPLPGYSNSADAKAGKNSKSMLFPKVYTIFRKQPNGTINITTDPDGLKPGAWINGLLNLVPHKGIPIIPADPPKKEPVKVDTSKLTPITMGPTNFPICTPKQAIAYVEKIGKTPKIQGTLSEVIYAFCKAGFVEDIRWDIAFAQAIKETGFFQYGNQVSWTQNNFAGIGATNDGAKGSTFETPYQGALAQIQHLKAYANEKGCNAATLEDPRFSLVKRGTAPYVEWLGASDNPAQTGWAFPGKGYGEGILQILTGISNM